MVENSKIENSVENEKQNEQDVHWEPVAKLEKNAWQDPYEDVDESIRTYHKNYVDMWLKNHKAR